MNEYHTALLKLLGVQYEMRYSGYGIGVRNVGLVFDVADLIKDTLILPWAFICAKEQATEQEVRQQCLQNFTQHKALDFMFDAVKEAALKEIKDETTLGMKLLNPQPLEE